MRLSTLSEASNRRDFMKRATVAYNAAKAGIIPKTSDFFDTIKKVEKIPKIREDIDHGIFSDGILPTNSGNFYVKPDYLYNFATDHVLAVLGINKASALNIMGIITGIHNSPYDSDSRRQLESRLEQISKKTEITPERIGAIIAANEDINRSLGLGSLDNIIFWVKKKNVSDEVAFRIFSGYVNQLGGPKALADLIKKLLSPGSDYVKLLKQNNEAILPPMKNLLKVRYINNFIRTKVAPELPEEFRRFETEESLDVEPDWYYDDSGDPFSGTKERFYESKKVRRKTVI